MKPIGNFCEKSLPVACEEREESLRRQGLQGHALPRQLRLAAHRIPLGAHVALGGPSWTRKLETHYSDLLSTCRDMSHVMSTLN